MHDPYADEPTSRFPSQPPELPPTGVLPAMGRRSFLRRHRTPLIVGAAGAGLLLMGGLGWAVVSPASTSPAPAAAGTPTASPSVTHHAAGNAIRGTVQSESGDTWTVRTRAGATITVTITSKTRFGRKNASSSAADFPVGAMVVITGRTHDSTVTASRISAPANPSGAPSSAPRQTA